MGKYTPPYNITTNILNLIEEISKNLTKIELLHKKFITPKLRKVSQIKTIAGSLQIEGNTLNEEQITAIIKGKKVLATYKEIAEIKGAIKAYENIDNFTYYNIKDFLKAHKLMMGDVLENAGKFRDSKVGIITSKGISHLAPPPDKVPRLMDELFHWLKTTKENKLLLSCIAHYEIEFIHPFADGNGRMGRLWQNVILNSYNPIFKYIPVENFIKKYQHDYYNSLEKADKQGNSTPFNEFMLTIILECIKEFQSNQKSNPKSNQKIISLIKKNSQITIKELSEKTGLSESGVKKILRKLKADGKIRRVGSHRSGYWEIVE
jgi:Fic family protein